MEARQIGVMLVATGAEEKKQPKDNSRLMQGTWENDVTMPTHLGSNYWHACQTELMRGFPGARSRRQNPKKALSAPRILRARARTRQGCKRASIG